MAAAGGLRERKRRGTLEAIQRNAIDLCLRHGYDDVSVDMICDGAQISQRTFFNYVGSKENAVLGITPPLPSDEQRTAYLVGLGGSPLEDLVHTLAAVLSSSRSGTAELIRKQFAVIQQNPTLRRGAIAHLEEVRESLVELVTERLATDQVRRSATSLAETGVADDGTAAAEQAELTVSLALMVFRHLGHRWAVASADPADSHATIEKALRLVQTIARGE